MAIVRNDDILSKGLLDLENLDWNIYGFCCTRQILVSLGSENSYVTF